MLVSAAHLERLGGTQYEIVLNNSDYCGSKLDDISLIEPQ